MRPLRKILPALASRFTNITIFFSVSRKPRIDEAHMSTESLTSISVLIYRDGPSGPELYVRSRPLEKNPVYSIPNREPRPDETAIECAQRIAESSLSTQIPKHRLDRRTSAVVNHHGAGDKIRVFAVKAKPSAKLSPGMKRGWEYHFIPLSFLNRVFLHPDMVAYLTRASLRELLKTT
ncbi:hypothetical protein F5Y01DRAFT_319456 [Xylaria sp. FL0043]|nr:hypothetical protein F5Y01DRAFT_319456 [Xylaria sp. FL0043]